MRYAILMVLAPALTACGNPASWTATVCVSTAFSPDAQTEILAAAEEWHEASHGRVDLHMLVCDGAGDLTVTPLDMHGEAVGRTDGNGQWIHLDVALATRTGAPLQEVAEHEFGHFLTGSADHSKDPRDVMYPYVCTAMFPCPRDARPLTAADVARLDQ